MQDRTLEPQARELVQDKIKDIRFALLTSQSPDGDFHTRPMYTHGVDADGSVWFFTYQDSRKVREVHHKPQVSLSHADHDAQTYVTLAGTAQEERNQAKMDELWIDGLKAWIPEGKYAPHVTLLHVQLHQGEYWDKLGGKFNNLFQLAKAAITGQPDRSGHHEQFGREQH